MVAEDQEQTDKIMDLKEGLPQMRKFIYLDTKGMNGYKHNPFVVDS